MRFFMPIERIPTVTAQQKRVTFNKKTGKPIHYDSAELAAARELYRSLLAQHRPAELIPDPIRLEVIWLFLTKDKKRHMKLRTSPPDSENLVKALKDAMTDVGFWKDDAHVATENYDRRWTLGPSGIFINTYHVEE